VNRSNIDAIMSGAMPDAVVADADDQLVVFTRDLELIVPSGA
jgi:hypothetical protein